MPAVVGQCHREHDPLSETGIQLVRSGVKPDDGPRDRPEREEGTDEFSQGVSRFRELHRFGHSKYVCISL